MNRDTRNGRAAALCIAVAMATSGCAGSNVPDAVPTPHVHELARLQQAGSIDQSRLQCVMVAAAPLAADIRTSSRIARELRHERAASEGRDHARSVQQGMAGSEEANQAARWALEARGAARQAALEGDNTRAAHYASYANGLLSPARDTDGLRQRTIASVQRGAHLTDEEADLFVEYAELRASLFENPSPEVTGRVREVEQRFPAVMEVYAGLLLDLYVYEGVDCTDGN